jgi:hypothetical protein
LTQATAKPTRPAPPKPDVVWVTPEIAGVWLDLNENNRNLRENHAASFARDMAGGKWREEVISGIHFVDETGKLGDGQHRLRAVEMAPTVELGAGKANTFDGGIWFYVAKVPTVAITDAIDRGARRSVVDALHFAGLTANPVQASLARKIIQMEAGFAPGGAGRLKPTDAEIRGVLTGSHAALVAKAATVAMQIRKADKLKARPGNVAIAYYLAAQATPEGAEEFFESQILRSEGLVFESPANALTRRLQNASNKRMTDVEQYNYIVHAWNHYRKGTMLKRLQEPDSWGPNGYAVPM